MAKKRGSEIWAFSITFLAMSVVIFMLSSRSVSLSPEYSAGVDAASEPGLYERIMSQLDAGKAIILSMLILVVLALIVLGILSLIRDIRIRRYVKNKMKQGYRKEQIEIDLLRKGLKQKKVTKLLR